MRRREAALHEREAIAPHFDEAFYVAAYPQANYGDMRPIDHFLLEGWLLGLNPSRRFDVSFYLRRHGDVAAAGMNPLLHYALQGAHEGRAIRRPLDSERQDLSVSSAPNSRVADWLVNADRSKPISEEAFAAALSGAHRALGLVISVSHDDYTTHCGGIQNLLGDEQRAFQDVGWAFLHLSPAAPLPLLATAEAPEAFRFRVRLDGAALGVVLTDDLVSTLEAWRGASMRLVVHHMMGHAPEALLRLARAAGGRPIVWTHDFFTLCPSYALMRNDVRFCGGPPPGSAACGICSYIEDRGTHLPRVRAFFEATDPIVLAPSHAALEQWQRMSSLVTSETTSTPLAKLILAPLGADTPTPHTTNTDQIRIAHLGARVGHKGWLVFEELAMALSGDSRYAFFHLGQAGAAPIEGSIRHVPVRVNTDHREAMIEAVAEQRIDVVILWSLWPETFCFAVHEALAGGAYVVAREGAGNVGPAIRTHAPRQGCVVLNECKLLALFESGEILGRVLNADRRYGSLRLGRGTADWMLQQGELQVRGEQAASQGDFASV